MDVFFLFVFLSPIYINSYDCKAVVHQNPRKSALLAPATMPCCEFTLRGHGHSALNFIVGPSLTAARSKVLSLLWVLDQHVRTGCYRHGSGFADLVCV